MKVLLFISALVAFIPAILAAAVPLESRQVGVWGKPTDVAVFYCYMDGQCIAARRLWQHCQTEIFESNAPASNPEVRNELIASCLCGANYVGLLNQCLFCVSLAGPSMLVRDTQTTSAQEMCDKKATLSQYEKNSFQFGTSLQFPLILPSLWIGGTNLTYLDQILIE
ncbi:hypothetical protein SBOR_8626 [Sclerotinia borealis F-4128]|uniref:Uncharacterized protein n=1 Tax=Sclerotinia borealis (strain F-4128) TaxID=1432307 RepID=W9C2I0_SCLBF|nr:hypothetical protein SBOR_8626 [Sclerotinia borealis F-4128]